MMKAAWWRRKPLLCVAIVVGLSASPQVLFAQATTATDPGDERASETRDADADGERLEFTHVLDDSPLDVDTPRPGEEFTEAVEEFHRTGENPYSGDDEAVADGRALYNRWCQACHMPDGSGRMGPALNDETVRYERAATDKGEFEIIYGGAAGAMQPFGNRMTQDEILRLMAFTGTLRPPH